MKKVDYRWVWILIVVIAVIVIGYLIWRYAGAEEPRLSAIGGTHCPETGVLECDDGTRCSISCETGNAKCACDGGFPQAWCRCEGAGVVPAALEEASLKKSGSAVLRP